MRKDSARAFGEERILVDAIWEERRRERQRFGLVAQLVAGTPVRCPCIERIEDHVAAFRCVELWRVFERRIVDDGGVAAVLELSEKLANQRRFAGSGVAHDEQMARFDGARNRERRLHAKQLGRQARDLNKRDPVRARAAIELPHRHQLRSLQAPAMTPRACPSHVLRNRDQQATDQDREHRDQRRPRQVRQPLVCVDPRLQLRMEAGMVVYDIPPHETPTTA